MDSQTRRHADPTWQVDLLEDADTFAKIRRHTSALMPVSGCRSCIRAVKRRPVQRSARRGSSPSAGLHQRRQRRSCTGTGVKLPCRTGRET